MGSNPYLLLKSSKRATPYVHAVLQNSRFEVPSASFIAVSMMAVTIFLPIYDRIVVPTLCWINKNDSGMQGLFSSVLFDIDFESFIARLIRFEVNGPFRVEIYHSTESTISFADPKEARAGIREFHFLPFNPVDKRTALTYIDANGDWHRARKGASEQRMLILLCSLEKRLTEMCFRYQRILASDTLAIAGDGLWRRNLLYAGAYTSGVSF